MQSTSQVVDYSDCSSLNLKWQEVLFSFPSPMENMDIYSLLLLPITLQIVYNL